MVFQNFVSHKLAIGLSHSQLLEQFVSPRCRRNIGLEKLDTKILRDSSQFRVKKDDGIRAPRCPRPIAERKDRKLPDVKTEIAAARAGIWDFVQLLAYGFVPYS